MSAPQRPKRFLKRPDDLAMKQKIEVLRGEIAKLDASANELTSQIDKLVLDTKTNDKRSKLQAEIKEIIAKQGNLKQERGAIQEQIKNVDANLKRRIADINKVGAKNNYKSAAEIDARIKQLDDLVGSGSLMLADERRHIKEMSSLRKLRKDFSEVEKQQKFIDEDKAKIAELKKKLGSVGNKEVQERFETVQKELNEIQASNKAILDKKSDLFKKRNNLRKEKDAKYGEIRKLHDDFGAELTKFKTALADEQKKREEEYQSQKAEQKKLKQKEAAERVLADASIPAFTKEIDEIHNLLAHFDPTYVRPKTNTVASLTQSSFENKKSTRQVEMPEDVVIIKKEQQSFFEGSKSKKNKKKAQKNKNFTVDTDVILSLADLAIPLPSKHEEVPETIKILQETLEALQAKQEEQTKLNIERAKARIAELEAEDVDSDEEAEEESN
ncbi:hypothetical protein PUMCH_004984 [Australozyma saopauloensis]|uniref:Nuclear segregation protein BFR1 n=1 Tax=Australozyma saopauloensis TaxID=291208 RepID=A0AAX4HGT8_9ASCO|nr:hypothetical protein PUMCH_004984 [[Candida] saopauloensis]